MNELTGVGAKLPNILCRRLTGSVLLVVLWICFGGTGGAATWAAEPVPKLKRHFVPDDRPELWPKGDWRPITPDDLQSLLDAAKPRPPGPQPARVVSGEYTATLAGDTLKGGLLTLLVSRSSGRDELLSLDPLNLAVSSLAWPDGKPPVWGTAPDGRTLLRVDRDRGELRGAWSLRGRQFTRHLEFDLELAPASVSRVILQIPTSRRLAVSVGSLRGPFPGDDPGLAKWRIDLGTETECRIEVHPTRDERGIRPLVLYERDAVYAVSEAGLQMQFDIHLEVFSAAVKDLVFEIPESIEIRSLSYGDEPLYSWSSLPTAEAGLKRLRVRLPDPILGPSRTLQLTGFGAIEFNRMAALPSLKLLNGMYSAGGTTTLRVDAPLEIRMFEATGHRQSNPLAVTAQGQTLTLQPYADHAELRADIGYPQMAVSATVTEYAEISSNDWSLTVEVDWRASSGSVFTAKCRLPADWELTDVRAFSGQGTSALSNWRIIETAEGDRELMVEFKDALTPENPQSILLFGRRTPSGRERELEVPVVHPLECTDVDVLVVFSHAASTAVLLDDDGGFESVDTESVQALRPESRLWQHVEDDLANRNDLDALILHSNAVMGTGTLRLPDSAATFTASVDVQVQLNDGRLQERYAVTCVPRDEMLDRFLVYLTTAGPPFTWRLQEPKMEDPVVQRLPLSRHAEMGLPDSGELWEIRIPTPQTGAIRLEAQRESQFAVVASPALAFIPRATEFQGSVSLTAPESLEITVEQLKEGGRAAEGGNRESAATDRNEVRPRQWTYLSATAGLVLRRPQVASPSNIVPLASASLRSRLASPRETHDFHTLSLTLDPHTDPGTLAFQLPTPAELVRVSVDGQDVIPSRNRAAFLVPTDPSDGPTQIELEYRIPVEQGFFSDRRRVVFPQIRETVLQFEWKVAVPPEVRWDALPAQLAGGTAGISGHWSRRVLGPLGRSEGAFFNPLQLASWANLLSSSAATVHDAPQRSGAPWTPSGWTMLTLTGGELPEAFEFSVWDAQRLRALEWIALFSCALVGLVVRLRQASWRMPAAIWSSGVCLIAAVVAPPTVAGIPGGGFFGCMVAILFPRNWLARLPLGGPADEGLSFGSTATIQNAAVGLLAGAVLLTAIRASAQEPRPVEGPAADAAAKVTGTSDAPPAEEFPVLIPVNAELEPSKRIPVVYVTQELIDHLKSLAHPPQTEPAYLITSVDYRGAVDAQEAVMLRATMTIAVLASTPEVDVHLPITNANLATPEDCLVDGVPHPVASAPDRPGLLLQLPGAASGTVEEFTVSLTLHPATATISGGTAFQCAIPAVHRSHLILEFDRPVPSITVADPQGRIEPTPSGKMLAVHLGRMPRLQVRWLWKPTAIDPVEWSARVSCLVELHPTRLQYHYHVVYDVLGGSVDHVIWRLPPRVVIRSVRSEGRRPFSFFADNVHESELLIEFEEPKTTGFSVDVVFTLPTRMEQNRLTLPRLDIFGGAAPVTDSHLGLVTTREFRLETAVEGADQLQSISVDEFTRNWTDAELVRKPEKAYRLAGDELSVFPEISFPLIPLAPERRVREIQEGRITPTRLLWTLSAEVTTSTAPAFQHTLSCDPRLRIDSISVQENEAERLVHWSKIGNHLILYLGHRTTGIQNVVIEGSFPLPRTDEVNLPRIRFERSELVDSQLGLFHDPTLDVELVGDGAVTPMEAGSNLPIAGSRHVFEGRFTIPVNVAPPRIRITRRDSAAQFSSLTMLTRQSDEIWNFSTILRIQTVEEHLHPVEVHVPAALAGNYQLDAPDAMQHNEALPDGSQKLVLEPADPKARTLVVKFSAPLKPVEDVWDVPGIAPLNAASRDHYLLLAPSELFEPAADTNAVPASLPSWILHTGRFEMPSGEVEVFRSGMPSWTLEPQRADVFPDAATIPLLLTRLWMAPGGKQFGETDIFLLSPPHGELTLVCPPGMRSRAVLVNGRPETHTLSEDGRLVLSLPGETVHMVRFFWEQDGPGATAAIDRFRLEIPRPDGVSVEHAATAIVPSSEVGILGAGDSPDRESAALEILKGLIAFHQAALDYEEPLQESTWNLLVRQAHTRDVLRVLESSEALPPSRRKPLVQLRKALAELGSRVKEDALVSTPTFLPPLESMAGIAETLRVQPTEGTRSGRPSDLAASGWLIQSDVVRLVAGSVAGLLGLLLLSGFLTPKRVDWLQSRPAVGGMLLGLLWWLLLIPSAAGFALWAGCLLAVLWRPIVRTLKPATTLK